MKEKSKITKNRKLLGPIRADDRTWGMKINFEIDRIVKDRSANSCD